MVGGAYKGFVYALGNNTGALDGTLSPSFDVSMSPSNTLLKYYLAAIPGNKN